MRQKFKGRTLYTKRVVRNILSIFDLCEEPTDWYQEAHDFAKSLSSSSGHSLPKVCGVIAALSPLKGWEHNKEIADVFLHGGPSGHTRVQTKKAEDILRSSGGEQEICQILSGNKITAFFLNILHPDATDAVTVDRHALAVALGRNITDDEGKGITDLQYQFFERCYRIVAEEKEVTPMKVQSATWEKWRELKKEKLQEV